MQATEKPGHENIAVILFNLGGPDSRDAIRPFLINFFMDPNIIRLPYPLRWVISRLIASRRARREAGTSYGELGGKSPLLENSLAQARALEGELNKRGRARYTVHVCMRYWHPMSDEIASAVAAQSPDRVVLLPLYPQFSTTTTWSSLGVWLKASLEKGLKKPVCAVCCYADEPGFIAASADNIRAVYNDIRQKTGKNPRVLFSAHGLPESVIDAGDPYQMQCEKTAALVAGALGIPGLDWQVCYQSRVGPQKWIGPSTEDALHRAAADNVPVVVYPHAFVNEHVETLVELDIEYRHLADEIGLPAYGRAMTVSTHPAFIGGLANMVERRLETGGLLPYGDACVCAGDAFTDCCMKKYARLKGAGAVV